MVYVEPANVAPELTVRALLIVVLTPNVVIPVEIVKLLNVVPAVPLIAWAPVPLKVTVPAPGVNMPVLLVQLPAILILEAVPAIRLVPGPMVKLPETLNVPDDGMVRVPLEIVTLVVVTVTLEPVKAPPLTVSPPLKVTVLVPPVNVPPLIIKLPVTECVKEPAVKAVPLPKVTVPPIVNPVTAVVDTVPLKVRLPLIAVVPACKTSRPLPLKVRLR